MTGTEQGERRGERGRQRCYRRRDKWKTIDGSWMMWEKITWEEGASEAGCWIDIFKGHFVRPSGDSACDYLKHSGVDSYKCLLTNGVITLAPLSKAALNSTFFLEQRTGKYENRDILFRQK